VTLVSAIIPTYHRNEILFSRALASVMRQTHRELEVLIVADGMDQAAMDDLMGRVRALQFEQPLIPLLVWNVERPTYPEDAGGLWSVQGWRARNHGLDKAHGEWVAPLDDDDEWTDDHVEVLLRAAIEKGVDFAYGKSVTPWGQEYGFWPPSGMNFTDGSQLYRNGMGYRYDPDCISRWLPSDADLWNRMIAGGVTFTFVDQLVHRYYPANR
jgi:glycosyltransferase involved in cell wall biosynthesis